MSNRRKSRATRLATRAPRCDRCKRRPAEHVLMVPGNVENPGYELVACVECWPGLQMAVTQLLPATAQPVLWCDCPECLDAMVNGRG